MGFNIEKQLKNFSPYKGKDGDDSHLKKIYILGPDATILVARQENTKRTRDEIICYARNDLLSYDLLSVSAFEDEKKIISGLKLVLPEEDIQALSIAMTIKRYEIHGQATEAIRLKNKLRNRFRERGNRIYNFYGSGLLREFLEFSISMMLFTPTITEKNNVKELFNKCIEYQEYAIFVNSQMRKDKIIVELMRRFKVDDVGIVIIFGRTEPIIERIENAIHEFIEDEVLSSADIYTAEHKIYQMGEIPAGVYVINRERRKPEIPIRVPLLTEPEIGGIELAISDSEKCISEDDCPRPKVGASLIKDRTVLSAFRGELNPGEHAEYTLMKKCDEQNIDTSGGVLITTLEPCTTRKHPKVPCSQLIIDRRISKVIIGTIDPNPDIRGKGSIFLEENGIIVQYFPEEYKKMVKEINIAFWKHQCKKYRKDVMMDP